MNCMGHGDLQPAATVQCSLHWRSVNEKAIESPWPPVCSCSVLIEMDADTIHPLSFLIYHLS